MAITNLISDGIGAIETSIRRVGERAVGIDDNAAIARLSARNSQRIAIGIAVIAEHIDDDWRVFISRGRVIGRNWGWVGYHPSKALGDSPAASVACGHADIIDAAIQLACRTVNRAGN